MDYYPTFIGTLDGGVARQQINDGFVYRANTGTDTAGSEGFSIIAAGNNKAKGNAGNKSGYLRLYGDNTGYTLIKGPSSTSNYNLSTPAMAGTIVAKQTASISTDANGWYKVNMGAYTIYFKNSSISSASYAAGNWGSKQVNLPSGVTFNVSKMSFSCNATGQDHALRVGTSISNNATSFTVSWHNCYTGSVTTSIIYNAILTDFTTPS